MMILHALRRIARRPVSAAGIVVTLTLGIGIAVGMFSVLYGVILQSLPYPDSDRVVTIHAQNLEQNVDRGRLTPAEAIEGLVDIPGFAHAGWYHWGAFTWMGGAAPTMRTSLHVSGDFFAVFGLDAAMGRTLNAQDVAEGRPVAVLTHAAWQSMFGGADDVVGSTLSFREASFEVVGVMPEAFAYPMPGQLVLVPADPSALAANVPVYRNARHLAAVGRLAPGASHAQALAGLEARMTGVRDAHGLPDQGWAPRFATLLDDQVGGVRATLTAVFAVAVLVLLIACANTASLVTIRLEQRHGELAVRRALGASDARIVNDVAAELAVLGVVAALGGILLAHAMLGALLPLAAGNLPRASNISIDGAAVAFAAVVTLIAMALSGATPLLRALRVGPAAGLHGAGGRTVSGGRRVALLPAAGIGLSTVALVAALALAASLMRLGDVGPGFRSDGITGLQLFRMDIPNVPQYVEQGIAALRAVPGVTDVTMVSQSPMSGVGRFTVDVAVRGREGPETLQADIRRAAPGYHRFMGIPLRTGRDLLDTDVAGSPNVVVINETLARRVFGAADPLGEVLLLPLGQGERVPFEVVGVVADIRNDGLRTPTEPELVVPVAQAPWSGVTFLVDAAIAPPGWNRTLQQALATVDPEQAVFQTYQVSAHVDRHLRDARFFAAATGWFAVLALLLAAAGINAVVAALQRRRTREIGVRMALGAAPGDAARLMLGGALRIVAVGVAAGGALALPALLFMQGQLFGVGIGSFGALLGITGAVLFAAALVAAAFPAWRAARVAPMQALRHE